MRFRVGTYNVHKCQGMDWKVSPERIAAVLRGMNTDVVAVEEISQGQAERISRELQIPFHFGSARLNRQQPYGNAIFSRFPAESVESYDLSIPSYEPRQCLRASLRVDGAALMHFFAVHLGTSLRERRMQALRLLSSEILGSAEVRGLRMVAGDFNEWAPRGFAWLVTRILSEGLRLADNRLHLKRRSTYPGMLPVLNLDHIFHDPAFYLNGMELHRSWLTMLASDHLPISAEFEKTAGLGGIS